MSEFLICGLKSLVESVPGGKVITSASDLVERVNQRHEILTMKELLEKQERELAEFERRMRDMVQEEITKMVRTFQSGGTTGNVLDREIRNYFAINQHGYAPAMFEGLLRNSPEWEDLRRAPSNYGDVLEPRTKLNPNKIPVLIEADRLRVLELPPAMFAHLLARQREACEGIKVAGAADVWVLCGGIRSSQSSNTLASAHSAGSTEVVLPKRAPSSAPPSRSAAPTDFLVPQALSISPSRVIGPTSKGPSPSKTHGITHPTAAIPISSNAANGRLSGVVVRCGRWTMWVRLSNGKIGILPRRFWTPKQQYIARKLDVQQLVGTSIVCQIEGDINSYPSVVSCLR